MKSDDHQYISQRVSVANEFGEVFSHFYIAENKSLESIHKILLPSFQIIIIFSFGAAASLTCKKSTRIYVGQCIVLGPIKQPMEYTLGAGAEILVANFMSDAAYCFFSNTLVSERLPLPADTMVDENCFTNLWYILRNIRSSIDRVNFILNLLRPYLKYRKLPFVHLSKPDAGDNNLSLIKVIAQQTRQTERTVQLQHKKYFGYSAKEVSRYKRFLKAIELIQKTVSTNKKVNWFDIIVECAYYDQSQLIHDFNQYLNLSPTQFLKFQEDICIANSIE